MAEKLVDTYRQFIVDLKQTITSEPVAPETLNSLVMQLRNPLVSEEERHATREQIFSATLRLIPYVINQAGVVYDKEYFIGSVFEVLNNCIDHYDPEHIGKSGEVSSFSHYFIESAMRNIHQKITEKVKNTYAPFHVSGGMINNLTRINKTRRELQQDLGRPVTDEELLAEINAQRRSHQVMSMERMQALITLGDKRKVSIAYASQLPDPDVDIAEAALYGYFHTVAIPEAAESLKTMLGTKTKIPYDEMIDKLFSGESLADIARGVGVTRERVRQMKERLLPALAELLKDYADISAGG